ncbi:MAG TPA: hypothetical protein VIG64_10985 [Actinomycetota bacterium]|jgi:hypothetical protein
MRAIAVGLVSFLALAACDGDPQPDRAGPLAPSSSPRAQRADETTVVIGRSLPDGPVFIEGSAAYATLRATGSGEVALTGFFDVPRVPGGDNHWPQRLRARVPSGRYELIAYQRPCDASACSDSEPGGWGAPTGRCKTQVRLAPGHVFEITVVADADGCGFETATYLRGETG